MPTREQYQADPERWRARKRDYDERNREKVRARARVYARTSAREKYYGITQYDFDQMVVAQAGLCAICGNAPKPGKDLNVDHDHQTHEVRGLLCSGCNTGLGRFKDSPAQLRIAIMYLEKTRGL